jgi:putative phage-type endonuclease
MEEEYTCIRSYLIDNKIDVTFQDFPKLFQCIIENTEVKSPEIIYKVLISLAYNKSIIDCPTDLQIPSKFQELHESFTYLCNVPICEQRSPEWYLMRHNMITASSCAEVLGLNKYKKREEFLFEKCLPDPPFQKNIDTHHGCKYEQIATLIYEDTYDTQIKEFGLIPHQHIKYLGASPDGISTPYCKKNPKQFSEKYGTMLEIKCPRVRKIKKTGKIAGDIIPIYYYVQCQIQLETCELDCCDFWQCTIKEYETREEWLFDKRKPLEIDDTKSIENVNALKGAVIELLPLEPFANNEACMFDAKYIYPPTVDMTCEEYEHWINYEINNLYKIHPEFYKSFVFHKIIYWRLEVAHNQPVQRDRKWFAEAAPKLKQFWDEVLYYRNSPDKIKEILAPKRIKFEDL